MLKTLDILIGVSMVMLLVSMIVTVITQFLNSVASSRGKHLLQGLADMLEQIHPGIGRQASEEISEAVLKHPLIRSANNKLGNVVHREELTKLMLELASGEGPQKLSADALEKLQKALVANGVCPDGTPAEIAHQIRVTLEKVRSLALSLELTHPELTNAARARIAMLQHANSQFLGKINLWFDQTMDRVSERFTSHTRTVTFCAGLAVALVLQLDVAALVSRLSTDAALRDALVKQAMTTPTAPEPAALQLDRNDVQQVRDLMLNNLVGIPQGWHDWWGRWNADNFIMKMLGILLTSMLLSLGAPFWYNALQNLIRLRSVIASKDDQQRVERQIALPAAAATAVAEVAEH